MNAEIIAVGSELLTPSRLDTNSLWLTDQLNALGVELTSKSVIGDDRARLTEAVRIALSRSPLVLVTGGLGPTEDDVTRDAVAAALGRGQAIIPELQESIAARFRRMGRKMAENNRRQASLIDGAEALPNDRGTAPGQFITHESSIVILLPGPPNEMKAMFEQQCIPRLRGLTPPAVLGTRFYRVAGMTESDLDATIAPVYTQYENPVTTILAAPGDIQIHLRARCETQEEAERLLDEVMGKIEPLLGDKIYSRNGQPLEAEVGRLLKASQATICVAESCTGGLVAQRMTAIPGSSEYFLGGYITYTDEMKRNLLDVDAELLETHTSVSEAAAEAMAIGARRHTGATYALSITGYAGPDGGTEANPVGTVYIGLADDNACSVTRLRFLGDRERVRTLAAQNALDLLRKELQSRLSLIQPPGGANET